MKTKLLVFCICIVFRVNAQINLVPNPSFEEHSQCPNNTDKVHYATGWWGINETPDYFHSCATVPYVSVPDNFVGGQAAYDGNAYIGVIAWEYSGNYREIVGCELLDSVRAGHTYSLSMRISRAGAPVFTAACNKLGMRFSNAAYTEDNPVPIDNVAHAYVDSIVTDSTNWVLLSWVVSPTESFKYLYLGNFFNDAQTDTVQLGTSAFGVYYYVDDVKVICQGIGCSNGISEANSTAIVLYDAAAGLIRIQNLPQTGWLRLYDAGGKMVESRHAATTVNLETTALPRGIYVLVIGNPKRTVHFRILVH